MTFYVLQKASGGPLAAKLESPPEEMEQGAVYSWLILICALFRESLYRSWRVLSTGLCHCEEAGFADEAIPKLRAGDCFASLAKTDIRNLKIFEIASRYPYLNGPFYVI